MRRIGLLALALGLFVLPALAADQQVPSFSLEDLEGTPHAVSELIGDGPVLFNFWATWCKPCLAEQPKLKEFQAKWADRGFRVVSVSIDDPRTAKQVRPFVHRHKIEFPVYLDSNQEAYRKLGGRAVPFNVLVGSDGTILSVSMGYKDKDAETWGEMIEADQAAREAAAGEEKGE